MKKAMDSLLRISNAGRDWLGFGRIESVRTPHRALLPFIMVDVAAIKRRAFGVPKKDRKRGHLFRNIPLDATARLLETVEREDPRYLFYHESFEMGLPLDETREFAFHMHNIEQSGYSRKRTINSREAVLGYLSGKRALFETIRASMCVRSSYERTAALGDEIGCVVGESGEILKGSNGNNRFAIARYLGIAAIPVQIDIIHARHAATIAAMAGRSPADKVNAYLHDLQAQHYTGAARATA
jgi:hypothetical protein